MVQPPPRESRAMLHLMGQTPMCPSLIKTVVQRRHIKERIGVWTYLTMFSKRSWCLQGGGSAQAGSMPVASGKVTAAKHPFKAPRQGLLLFSCKYLHVHISKHSHVLPGLFSLQKPPSLKSARSIHVWNPITSLP